MWYPAHNVRATMCFTNFCIWRRPIYWALAPWTFAVPIKFSRRYWKRPYSQLLRISVCNTSFQIHGSQLSLMQTKLCQKYTWYVVKNIFKYTELQCEALRLILNVDHSLPLAIISILTNDINDIQPQILNTYFVSLYFHSPQTMHIVSMSW